MRDGLRKRGEGIETREHRGLLKIEGMWLLVGQMKEGGLQYFLNTQEVEKKEGSVKGNLKSKYQTNIKKSKKGGAKL